MGEAMEKNEERQPLRRQWESGRSWDEDDVSKKEIVGEYSEPWVEGVSIPRVVLS